MVDHAHQWMQAWRSAGEALARVRREELRPLDGTKALPLLTGPADYQQELRKPKPSSGLVEQQRWFMKLAAMLEVYRTAGDLQIRLQERGWRFCLLGGPALQRSS
ncbi:MAG: hypothetical protein ISQ70_02490 [Pirellulales bacterium]|nr:hypothetical protein [Pirellulales bacterium]MBL7194511.1 hypothetical protein [Pirellulales bacterium]